LLIGREKDVDARDKRGHDSVEERFDLIGALW
jgi:hypothetical protein